MVAVARGIGLAVAIWGGLSTQFFGLFWSGLRSATIDCQYDNQPKTNAQNGLTCAVDIAQTAVSAVLTTASAWLAFAALLAPEPKKRDIDDIHPMLSSGIYTHAAAREADPNGYHRIYYVDNPEKPSRVRLNLGDRGIHMNDIDRPDALANHALSTRKRQTGEDEWWIDVNTYNVNGNSAPLIDPDWANNVTSVDDATFTMLDYLATNQYNSSCFLVEVNTTTTLGGQGFVMIGPSTNNQSATDSNELPTVCLFDDTYSINLGLETTLP
jgi:hypothetical protein